MIKHEKAALLIKQSISGLIGRLPYKRDELLSAVDWLEHCPNSIGYYSTSPASSIGMIPDLMHLFVWKGTPQGHMFWLKLHTELIRLHGLSYLIANILYSNQSIVCTGGGGGGGKDSTYGAGSPNPINSGAGSPVSHDGSAAGIVTVGAGVVPDIGYNCPCSSPITGASQQDCDADTPNETISMEYCPICNQSGVHSTTCPKGWK